MARGFNALKTETWKKGRHTFDRIPPHVSVTSHGAQVASQHCPILQAGDRMIPWCYEITRGTGRKVSKQAANRSPKSRNKGTQFPLKKSSFVV